MTRTIAHLLLLAAALLYFIAIHLPDSVQYKELLLAFSEAAMVGGIADWFAVTALFRHPLGLPFPHTAIIPSNKDRIAQSFGGFMERNFLAPEVLSEKLHGINFSEIIFGWLSDKANAQEVMSRGIAVFEPVIQTISNEKINAIVLKGAGQFIRQIELTPFFGKFLQFFFKGERSKIVTDEIFKIITQLIEENKGLIRQRIHDKSPWYVPKLVDQKVYEKLINELKDFFSDVLSNPRHPFRDTFSEKMTEFAQKLSTDHTYKQFGESIKVELLSSTHLQEIFSAGLDDLKEVVLATLHSERETIVRVGTDVLSDVAKEITQNYELSSNINGWLRQAILSLNEKYSANVAQFISDTVVHWDTTTLVDKFESELGRDLQFIRINGTVVGGVVGVIIYLIKVLVA